MHFKWTICANIHSVQEKIILSYFSHPATTESVIKIIDKLKNNMTCGPDLLLVRIIKEVKHEIAEPLSKLKNESIEQGICAENLKETKLIAIQKNKIALN